VVFVDEISPGKSASGTRCSAHEAIKGNLRSECKHAGVEAALAVSNTDVLAFFAMNLSRPPDFVTLADNDARNAFLTGRPEVVQWLEHGTKLSYSSGLSPSRMPAAFHPGGSFWKRGGSPRERMCPVSVSCRPTPRA
jgi:hypothetical protein